MTKEQFKQWRQRNKFTQYVAAEHLGVSRAAIARYESGSKIPDPVALLTGNVGAAYGNWKRVAHRYSKLKDGDMPRVEITQMEVDTWMFDARIGGQSFTLHYEDIPELINALEYLIKKHGY